MKQAIKKIQNKTNVDLRYILSGGVWLVLLRFVTGLTGFFVTYVLTQVLSKDDYGQYKYILSALSVLLAFSLPGINSAITQAVSQKAHVQLLKIAKEQMKWGSLGGLIGICIAIYYFLAGNIFLGFAFILIGLGVPFIESFFPYTGYYRGKQQFKELSLTQIVLRIGHSLAIVLVAYLTRDVLAIVATYILSHTLICLITLIYTRRRINENRVVEQHVHEDTKAIVQFGKNLSVTQALQKVSAEVDKVLIWQMFGATSVAVYSVARVAIQMVRLFTGFIVELALPRFSQRDMRQSEHRRSFHIKLATYMLGLVAIYVGYILFARYLFIWFFPEYLEAIPLSIILGVIIVIAPLRALYDQLFISAKMIKSIYAYKIVEIVSYVGSFFSIYAATRDPFWVIGLSLPLKECISLVLQVFLFRAPKKSL